MPRATLLVKGSAMSASRASQACTLCQGTPAWHTMTLQNSQWERACLYRLCCHSQLVPSAAAWATPLTLAPTLTLPEACRAALEGMLLQA